MGFCFGFEFCICGGFDRLNHRLDLSFALVVVSTGSTTGWI
jgi:hypothetical protein